MKSMPWPEFLAKMEWEGGIEAMLDWGGPDCFPAEIVELARSSQWPFSDLLAAIDAKRGF